jgi:CHASE2 domain-containing sensor protein
MIAKDTFPEEQLTNEGLRIAELMQEALGTFLIAMGILLFSLRNVDKKSARKAITGVGFASTAIFIGGILHLLKNDVHPPIPGIIAAGLVILLSVVLLAQD